MKKSLMAILIAGIASLATAGVSYAEDDDCAVPMANWQPREAVQKMAEGLGWTVHRIKIDDGCYEIKGRDAQGREIKVKIDPGTLAIVKIKNKADESRGTDRNAVPSGTVAPPANAPFAPNNKPVIE
jgi:hypothetical protein